MGHLSVLLCVWYLYRQSVRVGGNWREDSVLSSIRKLRNLLDEATLQVNIYSV